MTPETSRMVGSLSGNPIPFLIPIVLTGILLSRHKVNFKDKALWLLLGIFCFWAVLVLMKYNGFNSENMSYMFFVVYPIIIAYIHVRVFRHSLFYWYEEIVIDFCKISLLLWTFSVCFHSIAASFFSLFPRVTFGPNFLYIFHFMDTNQYYYGIMRNAGMSWEPGRFAIMICLAIYINLSRNGITFKNNKNIIILLVALATTMSTTGYVICFVTYIIFYIKKFSYKNLLKFSFVIIPLCIVFIRIDFIGEKIQDRLQISDQNDKLETSINYHSQYTDEHLKSLDRFQALYFEFENFKTDPLLGYTPNAKYSYFYKEYTNLYSLTGGLMKVFSCFGIFLGGLFYYCLVKSSIRCASIFPFRRKYALLMVILLSSISYPIFCQPIYTAIWFYGIFSHSDIHLK